METGKVGRCEACVRYAIAAPRRVDQFFFIRSSRSPTTLFFSSFPFRYLPVPTPPPPRLDRVRSPLRRSRKCASAAPPVYFARDRRTRSDRSFFEWPASTSRSVVPRSCGFGYAAVVSSARPVPVSFVRCAAVVDGDADTPRTRANAGVRGDGYAAVLEQPASSVAPTADAAALARVEARPPRSN